MVLPKDAGYMKASGYRCPKCRCVYGNAIMRGYAARADGTIYYVCGDLSAKRDGEAPCDGRLEVSDT